MSQKLKTALLRKRKIMQKELKRLKNDPAFIVESSLIDVIDPFDSGDIKNNPAAWRKAYISYLKGLQLIIERASENSDFFVFPLEMHINHLKDIETGNVAPYLVAPEGGHKPPVSVNQKNKELFIAAAMGILMEGKGKLSSRAAAQEVGKWCIAARVDLGGRKNTAISARVKGIRDNLGNDTLQKIKYDALCQDWKRFGESRAGAVRAMINAISLLTY